MYYDNPEVTEALRNVPPPPNGWAGFKNTWAKLAAEAYSVMRNPDGTESVVWVRGWRERELHAYAEWDADGRFMRGVVVEYAFRDGEGQGGKTVFRMEVSSEFELADWLMEYGY